MYPRFKGILLVAPNVAAVVVLTLGVAVECL